jgi:ribosomal protein L15
MPTRTNFPSRKESRQRRALERQAARASRGDLGQIQRLNDGGHRAVKERARLLPRLGTLRERMAPVKIQTINMADLAKRKSTHLHRG